MASGYMERQPHRKHGKWLDRKTSSQETWKMAGFKDILTGNIENGWIENHPHRKHGILLDGKTALHEISQIAG